MCWTRRSRCTQQWKMSPAVQSWHAFLDAHYVCEVPGPPACLQDALHMITTGKNSSGIFLDLLGNSSGTLRELFGNSSGTLRELFRNSAGTLRELFGNSAGTLRGLFGNSSGTLLELLGNSSGTLRELFGNSSVDLLEPVGDSLASVRRVSSPIQFFHVGAVGSSYSVPAVLCDNFNTMPDVSDEYEQLRL